MSNVVNVERTAVNEMCRLTVGLCFSWLEICCPLFLLIFELLPNGACINGSWTLTKCRGPRWGDLLTYPGTKMTNLEVV
jgi:hypothetical protein